MSRYVGDLLLGDIVRIVTLYTFCGTDGGSIQQYIAITRVYGQMTRCYDDVTCQGGVAERLATASQPLVTLHSSSCVLSKDYNIVNAELCVFGCYTVSNWCGGWRLEDLFCFGL